MTKQLAIKRALSKIEKLKASRDMEYVQETVYLRKNLYLLLEAIRADENDDYFEPGELVYVCPYILKDGKEVDGTTGSVDNPIEEDLSYLLGMYLRG